MTWPSFYFLISVHNHTRGIVKVFPFHSQVIYIFNFRIVSKHSQRQEHLTKQWDRTGQLRAGGDVVPVGQFCVALFPGSTVQL